ncbi:MAG: phosphoglucosamine mutase, partial [Planctomycetia bacterium]|nr:phosphoglucosamine mutase [Planctomycetia bacterium]
MTQPIISISGVRGIIGESMTADLARQFGRAFGTYVRGGRVVIGRDSRPSGTMFADAVCEGLLETGCSVVDLALCATPSISVMVTELACRGGVIISASHNPAEYNGIKFLSDTGMLLTAEQGGRLLEIYENSDFALTEAAGSRSRDAGAPERHIARVLAIVDAEPVRARSFKVVLDSVGGAGGPVMLKLLDALGAEVVNLYESPADEFPRPPEPTPANLGGLCDAVRRNGADLRLALAPDADRL